MCILAQKWHWLFILYFKAALAIILYRYTLYIISYRAVVCILVWKAAKLTFLYIVTLKSLWKIIIKSRSTSDTAWLRAFYAKDPDKHFGCASRPATPKKEDQTLILGGPRACYTAWTEAKRLPQGIESRIECGQSAKRQQLFPPTGPVKNPLFSVHYGPCSTHVVRGFKIVLFILPETA